ncbi:uncharacterized protein MELLADRAFT_60254 [Melampsora larici-populina 98AG31]|uniref:F-box domain-containing protein n=1 Tax=Melampsora larici-populina (strain 98AG31 / pathotype 3-4-7) TaxID=747676 RepID=F4RAN3_MELLP|nr:uncharacterized protein MELLADRAFT_60254 [Melampsora larici-populina 98AG31]EGG10513.1 hypothetical protein MELLADRAFT_60254 [Melampsora larici-populina 98AG31]
MENITTDQPIAKPIIARLPFEILSHILESFASELNTCSHISDLAYPNAHFEKKSISQLNNLRLVCKEWAEFLIPICFRNLVLRDEIDAQSIIDNWSYSVYAPILACSVRSLHVELIYPKPEETSNSEDGILDFTVVSMEQVTQLIDLLGQDIFELDLNFTYLSGVSQSLLTSISHIKGLKKLSIKQKSQTFSPESCNIRSLSNLLLACPNLEHLTMDFRNPIPLCLKPQALPNLKYFYFSITKENIQCMANICETTKKTLKVIAYLLLTEPDEGAEVIFEPIQDRLEGIFAINPGSRRPQEVFYIDLPRLCVFQTLRIPSQLWRNVRTLIVDLDVTIRQWEKQKKKIGAKNWTSSPKLKHLIFIRSDPKSKTTLNEELVNGFKLHGVNCHITDKFKPDELMVSIYRLHLNGFNI